MRLNHVITGFALVFFAVACAHGKMGQVDQALDKGLITKTTPIFIEPIASDNVQFSGDKSADAKRIGEEKEAISSTYHKSIAEQLRKKGFNAKYVAAPVKSGIVISGNVTRFEHGSAAARIMVGMGAGSSDLYTNFKIEDRTQGKTLSKFEVIATSGGEGGLASSGSYMNEHFKDGGKKVAEYLEDPTKKQ